MAAKYASKLGANKVVIVEPQDVIKKKRFFFYSSAFFNFCLDSLLSANVHPRRGWYEDIGEQWSTDGLRSPFKGALGQG